MQTLQPLLESAATLVSGAGCAIDRRAAAVRPPANLGGCLQNAPRCACKPPPAAPTHLSSSPSSLAACCTSSWGRAAQVGARVEPGRIVQGPGGAGGAWGLAHTD